MDGKRNFFIGGQGRVFWVEPGMESAWMCPNGDYVPYFLERITALAGTQLDGVWLDVPLLSDIVGVWPCVDPHCRRRFQEDTGLETPTAVDWNAPTFRRWVAWRHQSIWRFEQAIVAAVRAVRQDFAVISETVTMDYTAGTVQGLDGSLHDDGSLYRVWEVDAVSDATSMWTATLDDWMSMAAMMKYARGMAGKRPSWVFSYGFKPQDAERVMGLVIATGNAPYETRIPRMCTSVGTRYRRAMFDWLASHPMLPVAEPANGAAVLFSSSSRDYLDQGKGVGLYNSLYGRDELWWSTNAGDVVPMLEYMGDYRGTCKALIQAHVPFDVLSAARLEAPALARYRLIAAPSPVSLSDAAIAALTGYVRAGGTLLLTGNDAGTSDEFGRPRTDLRLLAALELPAQAAVDPAFVSVPRGAGTVIHTGRRAGQELLARGSPLLHHHLAEAADRVGARLATTAPPNVLMDLRRSPGGAPGALLLVCASMEGATSEPRPLTAREIEFVVSVPLPAGTQPVRVTLALPHDEDRPLPLLLREGALQVIVRLRSVALIQVELEAG
jgi:Beta-galactosidase trimerisation domain